MKKYSIIIISISMIFLGVSCEKIFIGEPIPNTILNNFDVFGQDFQEKYGLFNTKDLDWQALLQQYRTQLEANPTEAELYEVLTALINELGDSHVFLFVPDRKFPFYNGGISGELDRQGFNDFSYDLVWDKYVNIIDSLGRVVYYGKTDQNIGYIFLSEMLDDPSFYEKNLPQVIDELKDTKGLIIDIRDNPGGEDEGSRKIAGFFTETTVPYMISRYKIGPGKEDFEEDRTWVVEPVESERYLKPIALLTNRYSVSAAETFSLAMKTLPQTIQIGDTTTGAFSDVVTRELPNGWLYGVSVGDYRDANNVSFESIGLAPDILVENSEEDLSNKIDRVIEAAIAEIE